MPAPKARPATRAQIAQFGHIAAALRAMMQQRGWNLPDFAEALGKSRGDTAPWKWLQATGAPSPASRAMITRVTGIPEEQLTARKPGDPAPTTRALALRTPLQAAPLKAVHDVLTFAIDSTGAMRLRLELKGMPKQEGTALLRTLLDTGVVFGQDGTE